MDSDNRNDTGDSKKPLTCPHTRQYLKDKKRYCERCDEELEVEVVKVEHTESKDCFCHPELDYKDPDTGVEVWVHKRKDN
jgi:hypothetical protein